ncbi:MAG: dienelactone hydrolase family protein [Sulfitobacter sp.]
MADPIYHGAGYDDAEVLCIVVHGRNQTQQDMMTSIVERLDVPGVRYALPKSDDVGWYAARAIDPLTDATLADLNKGVRQISALIENEKKGSPDCPVMLCGFSQGACTAVELLMSQPIMVNAACLLTACRVGADTDKLPHEPLEGLPVYASCGDDDPWIPQEAYHRMLGDLTRSGARIRTDMFPGRPHEITDTEIAALAGMLRSLKSDSAFFGGSLP